MKYLFVFLVALMMLCPNVLGQGTEAPDFDTLLESKNAIKKKDPKIPEEKLDDDLRALTCNFSELYATYYPELGREEATAIVAGMWVDIRTEGDMKLTANIVTETFSSAPRYGLLKVRSDPTGATVILDRKEEWEEKTNTERGVVSGNHEIELRLQGYKPYKRSVEVPPRYVAMVDAKLERP